MEMPDRITTEVNKTGLSPYTWESEPEKSAFLERMREEDFLIDEMQLSVRAFNCLRRGQKKTFCEVLKAYPTELAKIRNMGRGTINEIGKEIDRFYRKEAAINRIASYYETKPEQSLVENCKTVNAPQDWYSLLNSTDYAKVLRPVIQKYDIEVTSLPLSARPMNCLRRHNIDNLSQVLPLLPDKLITIRNLGRKSALEILQTVNTWIESFKSAALAACEGRAEEDKIEGEAEPLDLKAMIRGVFAKAKFFGYSFDRIKTELSIEAEDEAIKTAIGELISEGELEYVDYWCYKKYPSILTVLINLAQSGAITQRVYSIMKLRLTGASLEEIGEVYGITRERIRQILIKGFRTAIIRERANGIEFVSEDYYKYLFENYCISDEVGTQYLKIPETTKNYLRINYNHGDRPIEEAVNDKKVGAGMRLRIQRYINRNKVLFDGSQIDAKRSDVEEFVLRKYCGNEMPFDEFADLINRLLKENGLSDHEELVYSESVKRARINRLGDLKTVLWKQGSRLRYYDIESRDYQELLEGINLERFEDIDISTLKLFEEAPELMEKYDIRDHYELHNLLKKILPEGGSNSLRFGRQPMLLFGKSDRRQLFYEILCENSPITTEEYAQKIHEINGMDIPTILASAELASLKGYCHEGVYSVEFKKIPEERRGFLAQLDQDFYRINDLKQKYIEMFADADVEEINPRSLKSAGFIIGARYVVQHYPTAADYFLHELTKEDVFSITPYKEKFKDITMFSGIVMDLRRQYEIVPFDKDKYISIRRLNKFGVTKEDLVQYCNEVYDYAPENEFFTIHSLKKTGFEAKLDEWGFDDSFYSGILSVNNGFSWGHIMGGCIFRKGPDQPVLKKTVYCEFINKHQSIDFDAFAEEFDDFYGVGKPDKWEVIPLIEGSKIYYDSIMNKFYSDKKYFYEELNEG